MSLIFVLIISIFILFIASRLAKANKIQPIPEDTPPSDQSIPIKPLDVSLNPTDEDPPIPLN